MKPLKIIHVLDHSLPVHSGYAFRSQAIVAAQKRRGWDPLVLTSPKYYESWQGPRVAQEQIAGINYYRAPAVSKSSWPLFSESRIMSTLARALLALAKREKAEIVHAHSPILDAIPGLWVSRTLGIPFIYEMRALWEDAAVDHGTYGEGSWKYRLVRGIENWICRHADHVTVLCEGLRKDLIDRNIPPTKLTPIPNGVDIQAFHGSESTDSVTSRWNLTGKRVVGFIGSFFRYEGLDLLLDVFARFRISRPDVVLLLVGNGEVETELKTKVKQLGLEDRVIMTGPVAQEHIPDVYAAIDVLAYPRRSMRLTELVTPLKPLEAMAMRKAIVASNIGGHRELIQDGQTGVLFAPDDIAATERAIGQLLDNDNLRRTLAEQGRVWVTKERSWDLVTAAYAEVYSKVLQIPHAELLNQETYSARKPA